MRKRMVARGALAATAATTLATALFAVPAYASTINYHGAAAQATNSPSNGAAAWVWVYCCSYNYPAPSNASVEYMHPKDSNVYKQEVGNNQESKAVDLTEKISQFRACTTTNIDGYDVHNCSTLGLFQIEPTGAGPPRPSAADRRFRRPITEAEALTPCRTAAPQHRSRTAPTG